MSNFTKKIISKKRLKNNVKVIKTNLNPKCKICAMVKANGYGHGLKSVVFALKDEVDFFGVANLNEALEVKKYSPNSNVLIVGKTSDVVTAIKNDISFAIFSLEHLNEVVNIMHNYAFIDGDIDLFKKAKVHIKVNSGMNRFGVRTLTEFKKIYKLALENNLTVEGVFTHFSTAGENQIVYEKQKLKFESFLNEIPNNQMPIIHVGGSGVILSNLGKSKQSQYFLPNRKIEYNMVRVGILLYGYPSNEKLKGLKRVMRIESEILHINNVKKGEFVGYGTNYKAKSDMKVAVVPVGYADGLPRAFSKDGYLKVITENDGKKIKHKCKITGNICMDLTMIDVTNLDVKVGDKVIILDNAEKMAKKLETISYEVLMNFNKLRT